MLARCDIRINIIFEAKRHQLFFMADKYFAERVSVSLINFDRHIGKARVSFQRLHVLIRLFNRSGYRTVNAFLRNQNTA